MTQFPLLIYGWKRETKERHKNHLFIIREYVKFYRLLDGANTLGFIETGWLYYKPKFLIISDYYLHDQKDIDKNITCALEISKVQIHIVG